MRRDRLSLPRGHRPSGAAASGALLTAVTLVGGLLVGVLGGALVFEALPETLGEPVRIGVSALVALVPTFGAAAVWARAMSALAGVRSPKAVIAGAAGYGVTVIAVAGALAAVETAVIEHSPLALPIHVVFTILFVPAAAVIAGVAAAALGAALGGPGMAWRVGPLAAAGAAAAFLLVNVTLHELGWVVGAPRAAERATMLVVTFSGNLAAALTAGGLVGWRLASSRGQRVQ